MGGLSLGHFLGKRPLSFLTLAVGRTKSGIFDSSRFSVLDSSGSGCECGIAFSVLYLFVPEEFFDITAGEVPGR